IRVGIGVIPVGIAAKITTIGAIQIRIAADLITFASLLRLLLPSPLAALKNSCAAGGKVIQFAPDRRCSRGWRPLSSFTSLFGRRNEMRLSKCRMLAALLAVLALTRLGADAAAPRRVLPNPVLVLTGKIGRASC